MKKITWKEIRLCDVDYFQQFDDEYEQAHNFIYADGASEVVQLLVKWFLSQPGDFVTNRKIMTKRLPQELYIMVLETVIDEINIRVGRKTRALV